MLHNELINHYGRFREARRYLQKGEYTVGYGRNPHYTAILRLAELPEDRINSSGYVVDTLDAALWCLLTTGCYTECVLKAVNLGGDADTTAAVAGGLAGLLYGAGSIPAEWVDALARRDWVLALCDDFQRALEQETPPTENASL
jgi:ADP-ribosylglycohydrolase